MLPRALLQYALTGEDVVPAWLGSGDNRWLTELRATLSACDGLRRREVEARLEAVERGPRSKRRMAVHQLLALTRSERSPGSRQVREVVFALAQGHRDSGAPWSREAVLGRAAERLCLAPSQVEEALFGDLPGERRVHVPVLPPVPELALQVNGALAAGMVSHATSLQVEILGHSRPVVRQALLRRLLCVVRPLEEGVRLEISGAHSLFRHTVIYGRRLASLLPLLVRCDHWSLDARLHVRGRWGHLHLGPGSPLPVRQGRDFDSKLEERLVRDLVRLAPDWEVLREPEPIPAGATLIFPDLALVHRRDRTRRAWVEVVGFWTPDYLQRKLAHLRQAGLDLLVLCVDQSLPCADDQLPSGAQVVPFSRRVDAAAVMAAVEALAGPSEAVRLGPWDLFIDYAGRHPGAHPIHARLEALRPGDRLGVEMRGAHRLLVDAAGEPVAALSRRAIRRLGDPGDIRAVHLVRTVPWSAGQSGAAWRHHLQVSEWLIPEVEVTLAP